jgi:Ni/Co efflux regulator RcnB
MKRLLLMMAAVASVIAATPAAVAYARDDGQGRRAEGQGRGPPAERGGGRRYEGDRGGGRQYERGRPGGDRRVEEDRPRPRYEDDRRGRVPALGYGDERRGRRYEDERYEPRPRYEGRPRDDDRPRYGYEGGGRRPPQGFAPPPSARRGGYLPRSFSGEIVDDYRRYRLRTPPAGFAWVRVGNGFALVSMADGQIFDMVQ